MPDEWTEKWRRFEGGQMNPKPPKKLRQITLDDKKRIDLDARREGVAAAEMRPPDHRGDLVSIPEVRQRLEAGFSSKVAVIRVAGLATCTPRESTGGRGQCVCLVPSPASAAEKMRAPKSTTRSISWNDDWHTKRCCPFYSDSSCGTPCPS